MAKTKVVIEVVGGLVQNVYSPDDGIDVEVEVIDLDVSDYATEDEQNECEAKAKALNEIATDKNWCHIY